MRDPAYTPEIEIGGHFYYPEPYSVAPLPREVHNGLYAVGFFAILSVLSTVTLISFIAWRLATWRLHYRTFLGYNQYVVLVLNLLLADLQQSSGFMISLHWLHENRILAPTSACFAQGWLIHSGDVSSGLFVLAIAVHTFYTAVYGRRISNRGFAIGIACLWIFAYTLTAIGPAIHGNKYFVRAGSWCWVADGYEEDRLFLHYLWIFLIEFGTIVIYIVTFFQLRRKTTNLFKNGLHNSNVTNQATVAAVNRITKLMTLYPCVYVCLTLPLSTGRMWIMAHHGQSTSAAFQCIAGSLITSCGWVDSLLYTLTRKRLLKDTMPGNSSRRTHGDSANWEATELGSKGITHTRTVTVENGQMMDTFRDPEDKEEVAMPRKQWSEPNSSSERAPSPNGSIDPILSGKAGTGRTKTEVTVGTRNVNSDDSEEDEDVSALPSYVAKPTRRH